MRIIEEGSSGMTTLCSVPAKHTPSGVFLRFTTSKLLITSWYQHFLPLALNMTLWQKSEAMTHKKLAFNVALFRKQTD